MQNEVAKALNFHRRNIRTLEEERAFDRQSGIEYMESRYLNKIKFCLHRWRQNKIELRQNIDPYFQSIINIYISNYKEKIQDTIDALRDLRSLYK